MTAGPIRFCYIHSISIRQHGTPGVNIDHLIKHKILYIVIILLGIASTAASAQRFSIETGVAWRKTIFYTNGLRGVQSGPLINFKAPYAYVAGVNGVGVSLGCSIVILSDLDISIQSFTTIRYDFYHFDDSRSGRAKTVYFDQTFGLTKALFSKSFRIGTGVTFHNIGKELHYKYRYEELVLPLHFYSIDFFFSAAVWKIFMEPKIAIVQENFPGNIKDNATLLGLRVFYQFKLYR